MKYLLEKLWSLATCTQLIKGVEALLRSSTLVCKMLKVYRVKWPKVSYSLIWLRAKNFKKQIIQERWSWVRRVRICAPNVLAISKKNLDFAQPIFEPYFMFAHPMSNCFHCHCLVCILLNTKWFSKQQGSLCFDFRGLLTTFIDPFFNKQKQQQQQNER